LWRSRSFSRRHIPERQIPENSRMSNFTKILIPEAIFPNPFSRKKNTEWYKYRTVYFPNKIYPEYSKLQVVAREVCQQWNGTDTRAAPSNKLKSRSIHTAFFLSIFFVLFIKLLVNSNHGYPINCRQKVTRRWLRIPKIKNKSKEQPHLLGLQESSGQRM